MSVHLPPGRDTTAVDALVAPGRPPGRYRWIVLGVATFTQAASCFFVQGVGAMGVQLQRDLQLDTAQLGLLLSAAQLVPLVGLLVAGELLDRYDERWVVGIGALVVTAGLAGGSLAPGYPALLLALLVVGAGYSTAQPGGSKSVATWFDADRRGFAMGVRQAGLPLGGALASALLPYLAEEFGRRAALLAGALVALTGACVFMGCYRRPPVAPGGPLDRRPPAAPDAPPLRSKLRLRLRLLGEPAMVRIVLSGTSMVTVQCGLGVLSALYLHDVTGLGPGPAALVLVVTQVAGVAGRIGLAAWSDRSRAGRYAPVRASMAAVIAGMALLLTPLGRSPVAACLVFAWLGFFGIGWYGPWVACVAESAPPGRTGFALGLAMAVTQIAVVLAPPALGLLKDATHGYGPAWGALATVTALALALTLRTGRAGSGSSPGSGSGSG
ncbi:MFS transporter [Kitasatospora sp. NPDC127111]|uniref:MFS transporter n=1 Tax=Kitasatospora sp. NPDC127111 TaxID=3345363 RepID=UPI003636EBEA